jgi:hypothetical protein
MVQKKYLAEKGIPVMENKYIDVFGNRWFAAQIKHSPTPIEMGDYILFNPEKGFALCLGHEFTNLYAIDPGEKTSQEDILDIQYISLDSKNEETL